MPYSAASVVENPRMLMPALAEDVGDLGQTPAAVLEEHGELRDLHDSTSWLATAARPSSNARWLTSRILAGTAASRPRCH